MPRIDIASTYLTRSTRKPRGFSVSDGTGRTLAQFAQARWCRPDTQGTVNGQLVEIIPQGFWKRHFIVRVDGQQAGTIVTRPWGGLRITLVGAGGAPVDLEFARSGFWRTGHVLRIGRDHVLLELKPRFNWQAFVPEHLVTVRGVGLTPAQLPLALAICGFCARLVRQRHAAAAG